MATIQKTKKLTGTKEWSNASFNIQKGCEHNCKYCYAKRMAQRFNRIPYGGWEHPVYVEYPKMPKNKRVMFPTTHDITITNVGDCCEAIDELLKLNNEILIVSKPCEKTIKVIIANAKNLGWDLSKIEFRFTIGSMRNETLLHWEPNAPIVQERLWGLDLAQEAGIKVSISCEPLLDADCAIVKALLNWKPKIQEIWIGAMNYTKDAPKLDYQAIYEKYKKHSNIKWKESFRKHLKGDL